MQPHFWIYASTSKSTEAREETNKTNNAGRREVGRKCEEPAMTGERGTDSGLGFRWGGVGGEGVDTN